MKLATSIVAFVVGAAFAYSTHAGQVSVIQMSCPAAGAGNTLIQVVVHGYAQ